jgi:hypothetical protein
VRLRPKVFDLLVYLVRHRERVVRREELVGELWDNLAVGDGALSGLVNELRHALDERGRASSSIRTVHARGYQFVTPVTPVETPGFAAEAERFESKSVAGPDPIGRLIERVAEQGSVGVVIEACEAFGAEASLDCAPFGGRGRLLAELLRRVEQTGFELHRLVAPDESQVSASRFARQVIESLSDRRGRAAVCAALPLPARRWLEDEALDRVAGGLSRAGSGPPDPLGSVAALLRGVASRRPIVILLEDLGRAGPRFAADLSAVKERLSRAPVLWVTPVDSSGSTAAWLERSMREAGFDHWVERPSPRSALDRSLCGLGLEPLPDPLFEALAAHVRGESEGLSAIAEWVTSEARPLLEQAGALPVDDAPAGPPAERASGHAMRRVEPAARRLELRSIRS